MPAALPNAAHRLLGDARIRVEQQRHQQACRTADRVICRSAMATSRRDPLRDAGSVDEPREGRFGGLAILGIGAAREH